MAYIIADGTLNQNATSAGDLLDKIITFMTSNGWTLNIDTAPSSSADGRFVSLEGVTDAGAGNINPLINFRLFNQFGRLHLVMKSSSSYNASGGFDEQPNPSPIDNSTPGLWRGPCLLIADREMPYMIQMSAQHVNIVVSTGNVTSYGYFGFCDRSDDGLVNPDEYPYPMLVAGSANSTDTEEQSTSTAGTWYHPASESTALSNAYLFSGESFRALSQQTQTANQVFCFAYANETTSDLVSNDYPTAYPAPGGSQIPERIVLSTNENPYLAMPRTCYKVSGFDLTPFSILNDGVDDYFVINRFASNDIRYFCAIKLS